MYKATTPTITFNFPDDVDMTQASNVYVTFSTKGGKTLVTNLIIQRTIYKVKQKGGLYG